MKVVATEFGFYGGHRRRAGTVFDVPEGATASWFRPVDVPVLLAPEAVAEDAPVLLAPEAVAEDVKPRGKKAKPPADSADDLV